MEEGGRRDLRKLQVESSGLECHSDLVPVPSVASVVLLASNSVIRFTNYVVELLLSYTSASGFQSNPVPVVVARLIGYGVVAP